MAFSEYLLADDRDLAAIVRYLDLRCSFKLTCGRSSACFGLVAAAVESRYVKRPIKMMHLAPHNAAAKARRNDFLKGTHPQVFAQPEIGQVILHLSLGEVAMMPAPRARINWIVPSRNPVAEPGTITEFKAKLVVPVVRDTQAAVWFASKILRVIKQVDRYGRLFVHAPQTYQPQQGCMNIDSIGGRSRCYCAAEALPTVNANKWRRYASNHA